tara:strand:- start:280 stop:480 length:201 start_codon:yes stop_codon:yes gene_type:complete
LVVLIETCKGLLGHTHTDVTTLHSHVEVIELWSSLGLLCSNDIGADILRFPAKSPQGDNKQEGGLR